MNKYIVAYISFFDNDLTQTLVEEAASELEAAQIFLSSMYGCAQMFPDSLDELKNQCFNMDSMISVIKI